MQLRIAFLALVLVSLLGIAVIYYCHEVLDISTFEELFQFQTFDDTIINEGFVYSKISSQQQQKLLCLILTHPENLLTKAMAVHHTWSRGCDKSLFVTVRPSGVNNSLSFETQFVFGNDSLTLLHVADYPNEDYDKLTDKVFAAFKHVHRHYGRVFDWFIKTDDDTYVFMENLRRFLTSKSADAPHYFGYAWKKMFHSGGGGYVLSQSALRSISEAIDRDSGCTRSGIEDKDVAKCLRQTGVKVEDTKDAFGRDRFHPYSYSYFIRIKPTSNKVKLRRACCSNTSISFHYLTSSQLYQTHHYWTRMLYNQTTQLQDGDILIERYLRLIFQRKCT